MPDTTPFWNSIVDSALKVWNDHDNTNPVRPWNRERILREIGPLQRKAFVLSILVGQVNNGGFAQWHDNRYSFSSQECIELLMEIDTTDTKAAAVLVEMANRLINSKKPGHDFEYDDFKELDDAFYELKNLDQDIEMWLRKIGCTGPEVLAFTYREAPPEPIWTDKEKENLRKVCCDSGLGRWGIGEVHR